LPNVELIQVYMKRKFRAARLRPKGNKKAIKFYSDLQVEWAKFIPVLKKYDLTPVEFLSIPGDAPKDFTSDREYRPGLRSQRNPRNRYIAKVGSKFYPLESIMEQMITRIGQCFNLKIADSKLRIIDGQIRFLSKYFLKGGEQLTHGAEIYEYSLGKENYKELAENKDESEFFSFEMTCGAITGLFPENADRIISDYIEMLTFDAIIGHNDRHPYNWGVIVPISKKRNPRFSPVFDTARALFWNIPEKRIVQMISDDAQLEKYIKGCRPPICWEKENVDFFDLIGLIWKEFPRFQKSIEKFLDPGKLVDISRMISNEFGSMLSTERFTLICRCLSQRQQRLIDKIVEL
jgi:hypothetical protein